MIPEENYNEDKHSHTTITEDNPSAGSKFESISITKAKQYTKYAAKRTTNMQQPSIQKLKKSISYLKVKYSSTQVNSNGCNETDLNKSTFSINSEKSKNKVNYLSVQKGRARKSAAGI